MIAIDKVFFAFCRGPAAFLTAKNRCFSGSGLLLALRSAQLMQGP